MPSRLRPEEIVSIQVLHQKEVPTRQIARQLGVRESTVRYHLERTKSGAIDGRKDKQFAAESFADVIGAWHAEHGRDDRPLNARDLFDHLVAHHAYGASYKSVLRYVRERFGTPKIRTYRRVETPPGAQVQTDWGVFPRLSIGNGPQTLHAFVMALSHSRKPAIVWSLREDQVSWLACHNAAFERLGGIAAVNRIDNLRTAIASGAGAWGTINETYRAYSRSVGFHIDACAPHAPHEKGKTEAKVRLARRLIEPLGTDFDDLEHLQSLTDERVDSWSERAICPATGKSVRASFEAERFKLLPLPLLPEPFDVTVSRPVHKDCTVHFEQRQYTVPFQYVGRHVEVRGCAGKVQIFSGTTLLVQYPRRSEERLLIDPSCYEGTSTERVHAPPPLGRMGRRLEEIRALPVEQRPLDLYAALAEVAR
jgi:Helix-turn-helix domain